MPAAILALLLRPDTAARVNALAIRTPPIETTMSTEEILFLKVGSLVQARAAVAAAQSGKLAGSPYG